MSTFSLERKQFLIASVKKKTFRSSQMLFREVNTQLHELAFSDEKFLPLNKAGTGKMALLSQRLLKTFPQVSRTSFDDRDCELGDVGGGLENVEKPSHLYSQKLQKIKFADVR